MVEITYETDILLDDPKNRIFAAVFYGRILLNGIEVCKIPLEVDTLTDDMYLATIEFDIFIKNWELQRAISSKPYVEQLIRFYTNVELLKQHAIKKMIHRNKPM